MSSICSTASWNLDLPPSCIAFCPSQPNTFVVGTYYLHLNERRSSEDETPSQADGNTIGAVSGDGAAGDSSVPQKRTGSLILFRLDGDKISPISTTDTDYAVLDVRWTPHSNGLGPLLAVATSTGRLAFYKLLTEDGNVILALQSVKSVAEPSTLVLSLAWHPVHAHIIGLTLSNGDVCLCKTSGDVLWSADAVLNVDVVHQHELEAWILAFSQDSPPKLLSGGDDAVLRCSYSDEVHHAWKDRKLHQAGVTAILSLTPNLVLTGSYDDHIRLISIPTSGRRHVLAEHNLGGGVWQLKPFTQFTQSYPDGAGPDPSDTSALNSLTILASCMHAGTRIVRLCKGEDGWSFDVVDKFEEHQSMNYGSDFQPGDDNVKSIISTSFYDKLLCLWQFHIGSS